MAIGAARTLRLARRVCLGAASLFFASASTAQSVLPEGLLYDTQGGRWGISVRAMDGLPIAGLNAEQRFVPASTQKLITTGAAFHFLGLYSNAGWPEGTAVLIRHDADAPYPTLILQGTGDAMLSSADDCKVSCLQNLASRARLSGITDIQNIEVDDTLFDKPYRPAGWAHDDMRFAYGTAVSALLANDGAALATVEPGAHLGAAPILKWDTIEAFGVDVTKAETVASDFDLDFYKQPSSGWAEITGTIGRNVGRVKLKFGLDDPSLFAGRLLQTELEKIGVKVHGGVIRNDVVASAALSGFRPQLIHRLPRPDPQQTVEEVLHNSNNAHAEILVHHLSRMLGDPSAESGLDLMAHMLIEAGAAKQDFNLADGSGLSFYNRISPQAMTSFLVWATGQPWYPAWYEALARNGEDGSLERRLIRGVEGGAIRAKTGTVYGADGLAGYFRARSGRQFAFAIYLADSDMSHFSARRQIDDILRELVSAL